MAVSDDVVRAVTVATLIVHITLACPTTICTCSARAAVICSGKRLERIPYFAREPGRTYSEIDLSRNEIFAVPPYAFDAVRSRSLRLAHNPLIGRRGHVAIFPVFKTAAVRHLKFSETGSFSAV